MRLLKEAYLPIEIKSQNAFQWSHWRKYAGYKNRLFKTLRLFLGSGDISEEEYTVEAGQLKKHRKVCKREKRRVEIIRIKKQGQRDFDDANLRGGAKPIPDGLKEFGWLVDDSNEWVHVDYDQKTQKEMNCPPGAVVRVYGE